MSNCDATLYVVCRLRDELYAVDCEWVECAVAPTDIRPVPGAPAHVAGLTILRGHQLPLIDTRVRLGAPSARNETEDFREMMEARERDHRNWLRALEESVLNATAFTLATDPHKCKFGQWYDQFVPSLPEGSLKTLLDRFDAPHRAIHAIATEAERFVQAGDHPAAMDLIQRTRDRELAQMLVLFDATKTAFAKSKRGIAVVVNGAFGTAALLVDAIVSVEMLQEIGANGSEYTVRGMTGNIVQSIRRRAKSDELVLVLDIDLAVGGETAAPAAGGADLALAAAIGTVAGASGVAA